VNLIFSGTVRGAVTFLVETWPYFNMCQRRVDLVCILYSKFAAFFRRSKIDLRKKKLVNLTQLLFAAFIHHEAL